MTSFIAKKMLLLVYKMWPSQDETMGVTCESFRLGLPLTIFPKILTLPEDNKQGFNVRILFLGLCLLRILGLFSSYYSPQTENVFMKVTFFRDIFYTLTQN